MYGVPKDLDLSGFVGKTLIQVCVGEYQIQFHFHPTSGISAERHWELLDGKGGVLDRDIRNAERNAYRVHRLLGQHVQSWEVDPPASFSLTFGNGLILRVHDDSQQFESCSIWPGDIFI